MQVLCAVDSFLELAFAIFKDSLKQTCLLMEMNFFNLCLLSMFTIRKQ